MVTLPRALGLAVRRVIPVSPGLPADRRTPGASHKLSLTFSPMAPRQHPRISNCTSVQPARAPQRTSALARASRVPSPALSPQVLLRALFPNLGRSFSRCSAAYLSPAPWLAADTDGR